MATCACTAAVEAGGVLRALARRRRVVVAVVELERGYDVPPGGLDDALAELECAGLVVGFDAPRQPKLGWRGGPSVSLTPLAAARFRLRPSTTSTRWVWEGEDPEPEPDSRPKLRRRVAAATDVGVDPAKVADRKARTAEEVAIAREEAEACAGGPRPRPTVLYGERLQWPVEGIKDWSAREVRGRTCPGCAAWKAYWHTPEAPDRAVWRYEPVELGPTSYCLCCDRWGLQHRLPTLMPLARHRARPEGGAGLMGGIGALKTSGHPI
jgi:hypothetical protein